MSHTFVRALLLMEISSTVGKNEYVVVKFLDILQLCPVNEVIYKLGLLHYVSLRFTSVWGDISWLRLMGSSQ